MRSVQIIRVLHGMLLIIILLSVTGTAVGHICFICGEGNGQLESTFPGETFPPCDGRAVRKQCPSEHKGCLTQTNGTKITKSCGPLAMNSCKTANRVEYCYCQGDLCNGDSKQQTVTGSTLSSTLAMPSPNEDDDEDRNEGSGSEPYRPSRGGKGTTDNFEQLVHDASPSPTTRTENSSNNAPSNISDYNTLTRIVLISLLSLLLHIPLK